MNNLAIILYNFKPYFTSLQLPGQKVHHSFFVEEIQVISHGLQAFNILSH